MILQRLFNFILFLVTIPCLQAQDLSGVPTCSQTCLQNILALSPSLGCQPGDTNCICEEPNTRNGLRDCVAQACSSSDGDAALRTFSSICAAVGVTLSSSTASKEVTSISSTTSSTLPSSSASSTTTSSSRSTIQQSSSTDRPSSPSTSTTTSSTESQTSSTSSTQSSSQPSNTPAPSKPTSAPASSSSLSTGAKAGIGIGAVVGAAVLGILAYIAYLLRKRSRGVSPTGAEHAGGKTTGVPELGEGLRHEVATVERPGELHNQNYHGPGDSAKWDWGHGASHGLGVEGRSELKG